MVEELPRNPPVSLKVSEETVSNVGVVSNQLFGQVVIQIVEKTAKLSEPVSKTAVSCYGGVPIAMLPRNSTLLTPVRSKLGVVARLYKFWADSLNCSGDF